MTAVTARRRRQSPRVAEPRPAAAIFALHPVEIEPAAFEAHQNLGVASFDDALRLKPDFAFAREDLTRLAELGVRVRR